MWDVFLDPKIRENAELRKENFELKLQRDELVDFLKDLQIDLNHYGYGALIEEQIDAAIAKAKGEE